MILWLNNCNHWWIEPTRFTYWLTLQQKGMDESKYIRHITAFKDYFKDFKRRLPKSTLAKIYQVFMYIMTVDIIPTKFLKAIKGVEGLYEIRVEDSGNIYRIFCCFDQGNLVVLFNAFQKKSTKTPTEEIERAKRIMKEYFDIKKQHGYE